MRQETGITPIAFLFAGDPVASGIVASVVHPGGNITGFTGFEPPMVGKWMELIKEIAPRIVRVAAIFNPDTHTGAYWRTLQTVTPPLALEVTRVPVHNAAEIERAIDALAEEQNGGLLVLPDTFTIVHRKSIVALTAQHRVPAVYPYRFFVTGGGLPSYGIDIVDLYRRGPLTSIAFQKGKSRQTSRCKRRPNGQRHGANLEVESRIGIPNSFDLAIDAEHNNHHRHVVWRKARRIGIAFD